MRRMLLGRLMFLFAQVFKQNTSVNLNVCTHENGSMNHVKVTITIQCLNLIFWSQNAGQGALLAILSIINQRLSEYGHMDVQYIHCVSSRRMQFHHACHHFLSWRTLFSRHVTQTQTQWEADQWALPRSRGSEDNTDWRVFAADLDLLDLLLKMLEITSFVVVYQVLHLILSLNVGLSLEASLRSCSVLFCFFALDDYFEVRQPAGNILLLQAESGKGCITKKRMNQNFFSFLISIFH